VGGNLYFTANPANSLVAYHPLLEESKGSDFGVSSLFVNDKWDLNNNFSFNVGVRYDSAQGKNLVEGEDVDDTAYSPRLGIMWDPKGNGAQRFSASYSKYASKVDQGAGDAHLAGWPLRLVLLELPADRRSTTVHADRAARADGRKSSKQMFAWFDSAAVGGINYTSLLAIW
jgi:hypothetical protein